MEGIEGNFFDCLVWQSQKSRATQERSQIGIRANAGEEDSLWPDQKWSLTQWETVFVLAAAEGIEGGRGET